MTKNKLLITGNAMGGEEHSICASCNYDFSWLFYHPSTLLWVDKIIITPYMEDTIKSERHPDEGGPLSKSLKMFFEIAKQYNIIEVKNPDKIITSKMCDKLSEEVDFDRDTLKKLFPKYIKIGDDKGIPGQIFVEGYEYCKAHVWSIYASLILAQKWNAQCLFTDSVMTYCKYKFGSSIITNKHTGDVPIAFNTIFNLFLPEEEIFPPYVAYGELGLKKICRNCSLKKLCSKEYLNELEQNLTKYLEWREYDEINQIKIEISNIIKCIESKKEQIDVDSIISEFKKREKNISKKIRSTFPKVKRWANLALVVSAPVTAVGIVTGLPIVSTAGATIAGLSTALKEYIKYLDSKYKWVGFINKKSINREKYKLINNI